MYSPDAIRELIETGLPDASVEVMGDDGTHFAARVISASFEGQPLVRQHQAVMNALKDQFDTDRLHALQLKTFTPDRWQQNKHLYPING